MEDEKNKRDIDFDKLCNDNQDRLEKFVLRLADNDAYLADDVMQETYLYAAENKEKLLSHPNPAAWFYKSARIFCKRAISDASKAKSNEESFDNISISDGEGDSFTVTNIAADVYHEKFYDGSDRNENGNRSEDEILSVLFSMLSEEERELISLHYDKKLSLQEIAVKQNVSYITVRRHHAKLLKKMRKVFEDLQDE